jgi:hypothetical protein
MSESPEVLLHGDVISRHPDFRMVLFAKAKELPADLLARVTLIDPSSSSIDATRTRIVHRFVDYLDPDLMPRLMEVEKAELAHEMQTSQYEISALELLASLAGSQVPNSRYSYLQYSEMIVEFCSAKDSYGAALNMGADSTAMFRELELTTRQYLPLIDLCHVIWTCLSRYAPKFSGREFSFSGYLGVVSTVLTNSRISVTHISREQSRSLRATISTSIFQHIFPAFDVRSMLIFLFITATLIQKNGQDELSQVVEHIASELDTHTTFQKAEYNDGSTLENLKYAPIEQIFMLVNRWIGDIFNGDCLNQLPPLQLDSLVPPSAKIPVILTSSPFDNPIDLICHFLNVRRLESSIVFVSLENRSASQMSSIFQNCNSQGKWLILNYSVPSLESARFLNDIPALLHNHDVHDSFRLVLNCQTTTYLSWLLLVNSRTIQIESFPSMRHALTEVFQHSGAVMGTFEGQPAHKRIIYLLSLVRSLLHFRNFMRPIGFNTFSKISVGHFSAVLNAVRQTSEDSGIRVRNLVEIVEDIFGPGLIEANDRSKLRALLSTVISSDSGNPFDGCSGDGQRWLPSIDTPIAHYQQYAQRLPLLASPDVLFMQGKFGIDLLNWNLSRYLGRGFLSLLPTVVAHTTIPSAQIPPLIVVFAEAGLRPLSEFWANEVNDFNSLVLSMKQAKDMEQWNQLKGYRNLPELNERRAFLVKIMRAVDPHIVDTRMIVSPKGFFTAVISDAARQRGIPADSLTLEFTFVEDGVIRQGFGITGLSMVGGKIQEQKLLISDEPFTKLPLMQVRVTKRETRTAKYFLCPIFDKLFDDDLDHPDLNIDIDQTDNFVAWVPLASDRPDRTWLFNGTSIYWQLPRQFK